jgi:putative mRNA 3-end processing factor
MKVRLDDGLRIETERGRRVAADASHPGDDLALLSHAHGDHLYDDAPQEAVASPLTLSLAGVRRDGNPPARASPDWIETTSAGHVPGSRAFLLEDEQRILYTGDCSVRDRFGMAGFDPPDADAVIIEATYGKPSYTFPDQAAVEAEIVDWLADTRDRPVVMLGYALGRAQELVRLAARADRQRIRYTPSIGELNEAIAAATGESFPGQVATGFDPGPGDALIVPAQTGSLSFVDEFRERADVLVAGFSGWAIDASYRFARDLDRAFPLSDHCDFEELLAVLRAADPTEVAVVHGFVDAFADAVQSRLGIPARALKPGQTSLDEF